MSLVDSIVQSGFARFVATPSGRLGRVLVGMALMAWGYMGRDSTTGIVFLLFGLVPLATGAFDLCVITALLGGPMHGAEIRNRRPG